MNKPHWGQTMTDVNDATTIHRKKKNRASSGGVLMTHNG